MTETSYYWDGGGTYSQETYHANWKILFSESDDEGIIDGQLNELEPSVSDELKFSIQSGMALVKGWFYENDDVVQFDIDTPVSNPRIDRIVLRVLTIGQTVRLTKIVGTEGAVPAAPALTQTSTVWDIPICQVEISTAGALSSFVDQREVAVSPLLPKRGITLIEQMSGGGDVTFLDIPQTYKHLKIVANPSSSELAGLTSTETLLMQINDGGENVNYQNVIGGAALNASATALSAYYSLGSIPKTGTSPLQNRGQLEIYIANYTSAFRKTFISNLFAPYAAASTRIQTSGAIILDSNPITSIKLYLSSATATMEGEYSLYGLYG